MDLYIYVNKLTFFKEYFWQRSQWLPGLLFGTYGILIVRSIQI